MYEFRSMTWSILSATNTCPVHRQHAQATVSPTVLRRHLTNSHADRSRQGPINLATKSSCAYTAVLTRHPRMRSSSNMLVVGEKKSIGGDRMTTWTMGDGWRGLVLHQRGNASQP